MKSHLACLRVVLLSSLFLAPAQATAITLVEKGQARAIIIVPEKPSPVVANAARVLQSHIKQMSGAELPVRTEDRVTGSASQDQPWVLVGEGKLTRKLGLTSKGLGAGGILQSAKGNVLALLGSDAHTPSDPQGTRYAVTTFLEDRLGVRYLWPGDLGKVVPRRETIKVADFQHRLTPKLAQRHIRSMGYHDRLQVGLDRLGFTKAEYQRLVADAQRSRLESPDWFGWHRLGGSLNLRGGHAFGHLWAKYGKDHPNWFALQLDGSRDQSKSPDRARLCVSNSDLIAAIAREKIEELNKNPNVLGVSIAPNDGGRTTFCTCPQCEALDPANGPKVLLWDFSKGRRRDFEHVSLTDRMVYFWNTIAEQVAKVHPNKLLVVDAYSVYAAPPVKRKLHPNLVVRFAPLAYHAEDYRQESLRAWDGWSKAAKRIFFRPNLMLAGRRDGMPLLYVHKFGKDFQYLANHSMMGTDFDSCCHHWATQGLNYYVVARLHWDPEQDVSAIVDDYCKAGFGPASRSIRRYFDGLEELLNEAARKKAKPTTVFHARALDRLRRELEQARRDAGSDDTITKRIAFLELGLRWTEIEVRAHAFLTDPGGADRGAVKKTLDERFALMRRLFREAPLALNVAYISWGEDALWSRLGWKQPAAERTPAKEQPVSSAITSADWPMYNHDLAGWRFNAAEKTLSPANVSRLVEKWRFPAAGSRETIGVVHATPTVVAGEVYFGTATFPAFYKLGPDGKQRWVYRNPVRKAALPPTSGAPITEKLRGAASDGGIFCSALVADGAVYFADTGGWMYCLDARTGKERWKVDSRAKSFPDAHVNNLFMASPILADGKVLFGGGTLEQLVAGTKKYPGSTGRGFLVALEPKTGKLVWKFDVGPKPKKLDPPVVVEDDWGKHTFEYGPATSSVWSTPSYDPETNSLFFGTDVNTAPRQPTRDNPNLHTEDSCAIVCLDARTGKRKWNTQISPGDMWTNAMRAYDPKTGRYKDMSIGDTPKLLTLDIGGTPTRVVGAGCKNGGFYLLRADNGKIVKHTPIYTGPPTHPPAKHDPRVLALPSPIGGLQTGCATDGKTIYTNGIDAVRLATQASPLSTSQVPTGGRVTATSIDLATERWRHERPKIAAMGGLPFVPLYRNVGDVVASGVAVGNGVVYFTTVGSGKLIALDATRGKVLKEIDLGPVFAGPSLSRGRVYVGGGNLLFTPSEFECFFPKKYTGAVRCFGLPDADKPAKKEKPERRSSPR